LNGHGEPVATAYDRSIVIATLPEPLEVKLLPHLRDKKTAAQVT
jgi:hypothetical protein